eukprot:UN07477
MASSSADIHQKHNGDLVKWLDHCVRQVNTAEKVSNGVEFVVKIGPKNQKRKNDDLKC